MEDGHASDVDFRHHPEALRGDLVHDAFEFLERYGARPAIDHLLRLMVVSQGLGKICKGDVAGAAGVEDTERSSHGLGRLDHLGANGGSQPLVVADRVAPVFQFEEEFLQYLVGNLHLIPVEAVEQFLFGKPSRHVRVKRSEGAPQVQDLLISGVIGNEMEDLLLEHTQVPVGLKVSQHASSTENLHGRGNSRVHSMEPVVVQHGGGREAVLRRILQDTPHEVSEQVW
mmetsp:Transcript_16/g.49  ORF Transcript_16/g.49 Transcript_16/m.49 type:complete len:228 (+) Transcript_16:50-733(+)